MRTNRGALCPGRDESHTYLALLMMVALLNLLLVCKKRARYSQLTVSCRSPGMRDTIREDILSGSVKRTGVAFVDLSSNTR